MTKRFTGVRRLRVVGTQSIAARYVGRADALLGLLAAYLNGLGVPSGKRVVEDSDGVVYTLWYDQVLPIVQIDVTAINAVLGASYYASAWVPRGFVVLPATDLAPYGWGMPVVHSVSDSPYDASNLRPGLAVARWTPAGPLGQLLFSKVPKAGYPPLGAPTAPMAFNIKFGPVPKTRADGQRWDVAADNAIGSFAAYRMEFNGFQDTAHVAAQGARKTEFELTNAHRVGLGLDPLSLPIRGFYSATQTFTDMSQKTNAYGHYNSLFYPTYYTPGDRVSKDGVSYLQSTATINDRNFYDAQDENLVASAQAFIKLGVAPNGEEYSRVQGLIGMSPQDAFAQWLASPPHRATIENTIWNGKSSFLDIGYTGFWAQDFTRRDQWLACGNAYWYSSHPEVPALSWHSFHTRNLMFETYPIVWNNTALSGTIKVKYPYDATQPLAPQVVLTDAHTIADMAAFNVASALTGAFVAADGGFYFSYAYKNATGTEFQTPALSSSLFMRGRCIGLAPNGGLILGAGIQKIPGVDPKSPPTYRLQIITHEEADQPVDRVTNGFMAVVHLYHVDLSDSRGFAAHAAATIKGIRGHPVGSFPWDSTDDPWAWVNDGTVDVSHSGDIPLADLLKYRCLWVFNALGTQAACLRDQSTLNRFKLDLYTSPAQIGSNDNHNPVSTLTVDNYSLYYYDSLAHTPRTLTLTYGEGSAAPTRAVLALPASKSATDYVGSPVPLPQSSGGILHTRLQISQQAVDYDATGALSYVYSGSLVTTDARFSIQGTGSFSEAQCLIAAKGSFSDKALADFSLYTVVGTPWSLLEVTPYIGIASVNDFVFTSQIYGAYILKADAIAPGVPEFVQDSALNTCWTSGENATYVWSYRNGAIIDKRGFANPKHVVFDGAPLRITAGGGGVPLFSPSRVVQPSYAKLRGGEWVFSYQVSPQPGLSDIFTGGLCADGAGLACWPCPSQIYKSDVRAMVLADLQPLGGWCAASFGDQKALASLSQSNGDNLRFLHARVV